MMEGAANEVRYKIAEFLLKRMHEDKLLSEKEREKIRVLKILGKEKKAWQKK